jgi:N6-adenosine-specific RNA methylase IME4
VSAYRTIVADPPWQQKAGAPFDTAYDRSIKRVVRLNPATASRDLDYPTMTVDQIAALPISGLAAADCQLYLWATNKSLPAAFDVMRAWGFRYSTTIVWAKALMGGGMGGTWRVTTEFVLFGCRGRVDARDAVSGTWHRWKRPYDERGKPKGSAKPPEFFAEVERVANGPYLELFARERRVGWAAWGNEVESDVVLTNDAGELAA